jgi:hypothetical protein
MRKVCMVRLMGGCTMPNQMITKAFLNFLIAHLRAVIGQLLQYVLEVNLFHSFPLARAESICGLPHFSASSGPYNKLGRFPVGPL